MLNSRLRTYFPYIVLFVIALLLYIPFQSTGLDDFDSYSFAFAIDDYDLFQQYPHPPGFPVYIAMGKALNALTNDKQMALTFISVIMGASSVVLTAFVGETLANRRTGLLAGVFLMFIPGFWLTSDVALSDVMGIASTLIATWLLLRSINGEMQRRDFILGCIFSGIALGVRPQNAVPIMLSGLYALSAIKRDNLLLILWGFGAGLLAIAMWLIPVSQSTGSLLNYGEQIYRHRNHVVNNDSLAGQGTTIAERWNEFVDGVVWLLGSNEQLAILIMICVVVGLLRVKWRSQLAVFCLLWFGITALQVFYLESLERPRLYLPFIPPILLLVAYGYTRWNRIVQSGALVMIAVFIVTAIPFVSTLRAEQSSPEQAITHIQSNFPSEETIIITQGSFRATQYYMSEYHNLYTPFFNPDGWAQDIVNRNPRYLVVFDRDDVPANIVDTLTDTLDFVPIDDRVFERDRAVFPQHVTIRVQTLIQSQYLEPEQLSLPESGEIIVADANNGRFFDNGWYRSEMIGPVSARWANEIAILRVALPAQDTIVTISSAPFMPEQSVEIVVNGDSIGTVDIVGIWEPVSITIPADAIAGHDISVIELRHQNSDSPDADSRILSSAYNVIRFETVLP